MSTEPLPAAFRGLVDDAAIFPPGNAPLAVAAAEHQARRSEPYADLVGTFVARDTDLPALKATPLALSVVVTGGAGNIGGLASLSRKLHIAVEGVEIALRDLDDLPGNARRVAAAVDAARAEGQLDDHVPVHVELPATGASEHAWLAAADEVAAREFRLKFRTGGLEASAYPSATALAGWIDAALDRETPFKCTAGLHRAVRHTGEDGFEHHGFLNLLVATRQAWDGAGRDEVAATLEERSGDALATGGPAELERARRWFTSFGSCSISEPLDDLITLGLLEKP